MNKESPIRALARDRINRDRAVDPLEELLAEAYDSQAQTVQFEPFFHSWFRNLGRAYAFLFRKNMHVTDIQIAELQSLVGRHTKAANTPSTPSRVHIRNTAEFRNLFNAAARVARGPRTQCVETIRQLFGDAIQNAVVIDCYWGSATVMTPPNMLLDIEAVTAAGGYIHSAGDLVWVSNLDKAQSDVLMTQIKRHLERFPPAPGKKRLFCAFAHEDFREIDRELASDLRYGLDDLKLWVDKFYIGDFRLAQVLASIRNRFEELSVPGPIALKHRALEQARSDRTLEDQRTIWLVVDRRAEMRGERSSRSDETYIICYDQTIANDNPLSIFDENKPAWRAQTTLPHSLAAAMINLAAPLLPGDARILDPFAGTGTTLFEAGRLTSSTVHGQDIEPVSELLISDNQQFFALEPDELDAVSQRIGDFVSEVAGNESTALSMPNRTASILGPFLDGGHPPQDAPDLDGEVLAQLMALEFEDRICFYLCMRATVRNAGGMARLSANEADLAWITFLRNEAQSLKAQISRLRSVRSQTSISSLSLGHTLQEGRYSQSATVSRANWSAICDRISSRTGDAAEAFGEEYDLIIADPPYGFNTDERWPDLAALYLGWLRNSISCLANPGQMVICLPERSRVGREAPDFARADIVYQLVDRICVEEGRQIVFPSEVGVGRVGPNVGRYYWESERALRRSVLHFRIM